MKKTKKKEQLKDIPIKYTSFWKPKGAVPLLPGCVLNGKTIEAATAMAKEAIALHLEKLAGHNQPIPEENSLPVFTTLVHISTLHV